MDMLISVSDVTRSLEHFDIVGELFPQKTFTRLPSIKSFSLRRSSLGATTEFWTPEKIVDQVVGSNLTRLQIAKYAIEVNTIPNCFLACPLLQDLILSICRIYYQDGSSPSSRTPGWSRAEEALHWARKPLQTIHIEYMPRPSFMALGIIPTLHLAIGRAYEDYVEKSFSEDEELFPHLQALSLEPRLKKPDEDFSEQSQAEGSVFKKRGISVKYDATCHVPYRSAHDRFVSI
jgi:hypothetical protein